jgi:molecular chaperone Hsp33
VDVDCEFCGRHYSFDAVDVDSLFSGALPLPADSARH